MITLILDCTIEQIVGKNFVGIVIIPVILASEEQQIVIVVDMDLKIESL